MPAIDNPPQGECSDETISRIAGPGGRARLGALTALADETKEEKLNTPPKGFTALFNGKDLTGWQSR